MTLTGIGSDNTVPSGLDVVMPGSGQHRHLGVAAVTVSPARQNVAALVWTEFRANTIFWLGFAALVVPTIVEIAMHGWDTDQGAHGPIVLATAIWIFLRNAPSVAAIARPPRLAAAAAAIAPCLLLYLAARITGLIEVRGIAVYLTIVATLFAVGGLPTLKLLWFPIIYSVFLIPIPDSLVDIATQPVKLGISSSVVGILAKLGYPVATSGVSIYIGQFELLIAAACAGLNSLISLTAVGSLYVYLRRNASLRYTLLLVLMILPIAVFANFVRVLVLVLLTYYAGDAVAQGFLHEFAGMFMFVVSLMTIFAVDRTLDLIRHRFAGRHLRD